MLSEFDISTFDYGSFIIYAITKDIYGNEATDVHTINKLQEVNLWITADDQAKVYVNSLPAIYDTPEEVGEHVDLVPDTKGNKWYEEAYEDTGWESVSEAKYTGTWGATDDFPTGTEGIWIWSDNSVTNGGIDKYIFLRCSLPDATVTEYRVMTESNDDVMGLTSPEEQTCLEGSTATVVATPKEGFERSRHL